MFQVRGLTLNFELYHANKSHFAVDRALIQDTFDRCEPRAVRLEIRNERPDRTRLADELLSRSIDQGRDVRPLRHNACGLCKIDATGNPIRGRFTGVDQLTNLRAQLQI